MRCQGHREQQKDQKHPDWGVGVEQLTVPDPLTGLKRMAKKGARLQQAASSMGTMPEAEAAIVAATWRMIQVGGARKRVARYTMLQALVH